MRRKLANFLAVLCIVLAVPVVAFWVRSHWVVDKVIYWPPVPPQSSSMYLASCEPGRLGFTLQSYDFSADKRDEFIATKREQHEVSEGVEWESTRLAEMRPEIAAAYRMGFTIASERFQPWPIEWDKGEMAKTWGIEGIRYRGFMLAVPHWLVVLALLAFPILLVARRFRRRVRQERDKREDVQAAGGPAVA
jgi:hypothetical protein